MDAAVLPGLMPIELATAKRAMLALTLALPRVTGMLWTLPAFAMNDLPSMVRYVLAIAMCMPILPWTYDIAGSIEFTPLGLLVLLFKELAIGAFIGFGLAVFVWVFAHLGEIVDIQSGYSNLNIFNNVTSDSSGPFATMSMQAGITLFVAIGGMQVALKTLFESYLIWGVGSYLPSQKLMLDLFIINYSETMFSLTVKLAAPAILILSALEVALGLVSRFGQQLDISSISFAIKALAALVVVAVLLTFSITVVGDVAQAAQTLVAFVLGATQAAR